MSSFEKYTKQLNIEKDGDVEDGGDLNGDSQGGDDSLKNNKDSYVYDNSTSPACNAIMERIEVNPGFSYIWMRVKPILRGKILYTPDTPTTREIVKRMDSSFDPFRTLIAAAETWSSSRRSIVKLASSRRNSDLLEVSSAEIFE